jgi:hypothetical protein
VANLALLKSSPLRTLIAFAWCMMVGLVASLIRGVVAPGMRDGYAEFTGHFLWVPYLSLAGLLWWASETRNQRHAIVSFTRMTLGLAMACGVVDLVLLGWSGDPTSNITRASPWRFVGYWALSVAWLAWLGRPTVDRWVADGVGATSDER